MIPKTRFSLIHSLPAPAFKRTHAPRGFVFVRLGLLTTIACLLTSCASFQDQFDKDFVNSRLMRLASNPDEIIPDFAWADHGCESANLFGGGSSSGGGGCTT